MKADPAAEPPPSAPTAAAFGHRDFRFFVGARFFWVLALESLNVAVGWQIYAITHRALDLGLVGLAQFLPFFGFTLITGTIADRFDRRAVLMVCHGVLALCALALFVQARHGASVAPIYGVLVLVGSARAFSAPTAQAFLPDIVPAEHFQNAVAWNSTVFTTATIAGPALGGLVYGAAASAWPVYLMSLLLEVCAVVALGLLRRRTGRLERAPTSWRTALAGVRYVWRQRPILGAISLDMVAVLLGGAVALLPIYAKDILHSGAFGLGLLRSAPAVGAMLTSVLLAARPIRRRSGAWMFCAVAVFGAGTIAFGLSRSFAWSLFFLALIGAADMVSVYVRSTLVQMSTPPQMRGRVSAVNMLFIGVSNELGEFESGLTAQWLGAVRAVVLGGLGTLVIVGTYVFGFPMLRQVDRLEDVKPLE